MTIAAMLRVKNEARWIAEVLASILPLTERIFVLDDHSSDGTPEIAAQYAEVLESPFLEGDTNESRDKQWLLNIVKADSPDYVLAIDGDEVLAPSAADKVRRRLKPEWCVYTFPIRYLWNDRQHYRGDGVYGRFQRASMFSLINQPDACFESTQWGCNFHCGNVPAGLKGSGATVQSSLLHLGYMLPEDRIRKYHWYRQKDPIAKGEDGYRHMVIGDVFPADSKFLHGGPLKLFPMPGSTT